MRRIALSSRELAPLRGWGAGTYAALQALALARAGCEVHLFSDAPDVLIRGPKLYPGVVLHHVDLTRGDEALPGYENEHFRYSLAVMRAIRKVHETAPFDVIEFPDVGAEGYFTLRARQCGEFDRVSFVLRLHLCDHQIRTLNEMPWEDRWLGTLRAMEKFCIAESDVLLAPSHVAARQTIQSVGASASRIRVLRNPFSADLMETQSPRIVPARHRVLYTGRLEKRKGVMDFVAAAITVLDQGVDAEFVMIGGDTPTAPGARSMREHLGKMIPSNQRERFTFIDSQMPRHEIVAQLRASTICCFPAETDNLPFAALEAMHERCALITTDGCGLSEILRDGEDSLVVKSGDVDAIAAAMKQLLVDEQLRHSLEEAAARTLRRECDPSTVTAKYIEATAATIKTRNAVVCDESFAVIIPVFNSHHYLDQTIRSVRQQTVKPTEIIVVDDGSTNPETIRVLNSLRDVTLFRQDNRGLSEARNAGVRAAHGVRWVLMLDSDDILEPEFVSHALRAARCNPDVSAITAPMVCFMNEDPERRMVFVPVGLERELLPVWNCAGPSIALIDRSALLRVGGYDSAFEAFEDWDLWCAFARAGERMIVLPDFLILNRIRSESMLRTLSRDRADMLRMLIQHKYSELSHDPALTLRMLHGEIVSRARNGEYSDTNRILRSFVDSTLRYRIADRVNEAVKRLGVHDTLKRVLKNA